jgi:hypothetical protein
VADGQGGRLGVLTGEGHDLGERLWGKGGGSAGARVIGEDPRDDREELGVGGALRGGGIEAGNGLGPPLTPEASRLAMEVELASDLIVGQTIGGKADDLETTEQLLGGMLASSEVVEQLALAFCKLDGKRARAGHRIGSFPGHRSRRVQSSRPKSIPSNPWWGISARLY